MKENIFQNFVANSVRLSNTEFRMSKTSANETLEVINLRVPRRMREAVDVVAGNEEMDRSKFIRKAIREKLARHYVRLNSIVEH